MQDEVDSYSRNCIDYTHTRTEFGKYFYTKMHVDDRQKWWWYTDAPQSGKALWYYSIYGSTCAFYPLNLPCVYVCILLCQYSCRRFASILFSLIVYLCVWRYIYNFVYYCHFYTVFFSFKNLKPCAIGTFFHSTHRFIVIPPKSTLLFIVYISILKWVLFGVRALRIETSLTELELLDGSACYLVERSNPSMHVLATWMARISACMY